MLVVVTGCDGCGKSTAVRALAAHMQLRGVRTQVIDTWSLNDRNLYPECRFISADVKQIKECGNEMRSPERALFLFWMIANSSRHAAPGDPSILYIADGFWAKHIGNEVVRGFPEHTAFALADLLPQADLTFLLRVPPAVALARKKSQITRFECGSEEVATEAGFISLQTRLQAKLDLWGKARQWVSVDAAGTLESVHQKMISRIDTLLQRNAPAFEGCKHAAPEACLPV